MPITRMLVGETSSGTKVERLVLFNDRGCRIELLTLGAAMHMIVVPDRHGALGNVLLSPADLRAREIEPYFGSLIGRYANRISGGGFRLGNRYWRLPGSENGEIVLHGGQHNFSSALWQADVCSASNLVRMNYTDFGCHSGFPGDLAVTADFELLEDRLRLSIQATGTQLTPINLTSHPYFNLSAGRAPTILSHELMIHSNRIALLDEDHLPTGAIANTAGSPFDLSRPTPIGERLFMPDNQLLQAKGFNHFFVLREGPGEVKILLTLSDPLTGRAIDVAGNQPGVQIYTANHFAGTVKGLEDRALEAYCGIAIEPHGFPNAINIASFPPSLLEPGDIYSHITEFRFRTS